MRRSLRWLLAPALIVALLPALPAAARPAGPRASEPQVGSPGAEEDLGVFTTLCRYSHSAPDDPIVHPGMPGMSHLHDFFGNVSTNAASTYESLRASGTTCRAPQDASGYWVPALMQNGTQVKPLAAKVYYRGVLDDAASTSIQPFPPGFRMVAGDAMATSPQGGITFWSCKETTIAGLTPPVCLAGAPLSLHVRFPDCWDGASLDSADHKSHMAYARRGVCPADHPQLTPKLALIVHYPITGDPGTITLASGSVYSGHADFFNAWDQAFLTREVEACLQSSTRCGPA